MAKIHQINGPQPGRDFILEQPLITVGRSEKNTLVLNDVDISRRHAQIENRGGLYYLKDLGSVNGTFVNGKKITEMCLRNGDEIKIGYTKFFFFLDNNYIPSEFLIRSRQGIPLGKTAQQPREAIPSNTLFFSLEDLNFARSADQQALGYIRDKKGISSLNIQKPKEDQKTQAEDHDLIAKYAILFKISDVLIQPMTFTTLLDRILDLLIEIFPADRGFIFTFDEIHEELLLETQKPKPKEEQHFLTLSDLPVSSTLLKEVLDKKVSVLTKDAALDQRFGSSESIHLSNIRSAMLTPLIFKDKFLGIIQLDSLKLVNAFDPSDMDLFVAVSRQIAVSIHSKRLDDEYLREKSFRDTLSRFHSPEVVESLFQKGERANMEMENKVCTILFSDVKGFTALSEKLPPMDIAGLMNEYFTLMADVVFRFNGTLDKFIGDSVMAVFGAPIQRAPEDDASRAIKTAIEMQKAVVEMNKQRPEDTQFHIRIGVNTGPCVAGLVGSPQRMEYTVLGDSVNTASRIESNTPPGKIYMSEETYRLVQTQFKTKELDPILAKNKTKPVKMYEILY